MYTKALNFAKHAHKGQVRKYTGEPYINHCIAVSEIIRTAGFSIEVIAAALLHDVLEDTAITCEELEKEFGKRITTLVVECTRQSKLTDGCRDMRLAIDAHHFSKSSKAGKSIKLADMIDNICSGIKNNPKYYRKYLMEKDTELKALVGGDQHLLITACFLIASYGKTLDKWIEK